MCSSDLLLIVLGMLLTGGVWSAKQLATPKDWECSMPWTQEGPELDCAGRGLRSLWKEWTSWVQAGFPTIEGWDLAVRAGQELRRAWDLWDYDGTIAERISTVVHGS